MTVHFLELILMISVPPLWIIPLAQSYHYLKNYKEYGLKNPRVLSSMMYVIGSLIAYYDFFVYSKMEGNLYLLTSHWIIWRIFFSLFFSASMFLILVFAKEIYNKWRGSSRG